MNPGKKSGMSRPLVKLESKQKCAGTKREPLVCAKKKRSMRFFILVCCYAEQLQSKEALQRRDVLSSFIYSLIKASLRNWVFALTTLRSGACADDYDFERF